MQHPVLRRQINRLALLPILVLPFVVASLQAAPENGADASIVGVLWTGEPGIRETSAQIMARQTAANLKEKPARPMKPEREVEWRRWRPSDPLSPAVSQWPPPSGETRAVPGAHIAQTVGVNFTGPTLTDTAAFPPDTMGTVGPSQFMVFLNGRIRTFSKSGVADGVLNADPDVFFASVITPVGGSVLFSFTSDPNVRYDRLSGRWFLTIIDVPCTNASCSTLASNRILLAVSDAASGGVISGSTVWTFFFVQQGSLPTTTTNFLDYPSLGIDANALYVGGNMFTPAGSFAGCDGFVIRKSSVLGMGSVVATALRGLVVGSGDGPFSPRGVDNFDPSATVGYFVGVSNTVFSRLILRQVTDPGGTPSAGGNLNITVPTTNFSNRVPHQGNTGGAAGQLDSLDDRLYAAHLRNGHLWTAHNIRVSATGVASTAAAARNAVRWYDLNVPAVGAPSLSQSGTVFDSAAALADARHFWIPSAMVSGQGHVALSFSTAGTMFDIDAATVGRLASDPLGTTQSPFVNYTTFNGLCAYNPPSDPGGGSGRRWGDYSFTSLDPLDDMTLWTIQEFCLQNNIYAVQAVQLIAPPPATPDSTDQPSGVVAGQPSVNVVVTGVSSQGSGFYDPGTHLSAPALPFNHISAVVTGGVTVNSVTFVSPTQVTLNISTVGASPGAQDITVTNPDGQSETGSGILLILGAPTSTPTSTATATSTGTPTSTATSTATSTGTPTSSALLRCPARL